MLPQQPIDIVFAALCCWREARGELELGKLGVLCVIRNRVRKHWAKDLTYQDVCCHPWQFSGMSAPGDPNLHKWPSSNDGVWFQCLELAEKVVMGQESDITGGAVFYHDNSLPEAPDSWGAVVRTAEIGHFIFYRGA